MPDVVGVNLFVEISVVVVVVCSSSKQTSQDGWTSKVEKVGGHQKQLVASLVCKFQSILSFLSLLFGAFTFLVYRTWEMRGVASSHSRLERAIGSILAGQLDRRPDEEASQPASQTNQFHRSIKRMRFFVLAHLQTAWYWPVRELVWYQLSGREKNFIIAC